jgi:murein DD-endopeptidase MepM/ murein hydrolase activator NlpD
MSAVIDVPKPDDAGSGVTAIANTKMSYANIRSGPGVSYRDVGDLRNNTLVLYFPNTRTSDDWYWMELNGIGGWVAGSVVDFEEAVTPPDEGVETPYDGHVAIWHWKGQSVPENTIEELAANIKRLAPNVNAVWVKTSDGSNWMGDFDTSQMAIHGPDDVKRWVQVLADHGLEFHAWCVPQGLDVAAETSIIADVCNVPGVKSMILDVEPYQGFWQGERDGVRPYMMAIRRAIGGDYHIGMTVDPRSQHFQSIFPDEWFPFVNSIHTQSYWATFRKTPEQTLQETYDVWGTYGRPVLPVLQGDAPLIDQIAAHTLSTSRHGARGVSWWRYGVISQFGAVNLEVEYDPSEDRDEEGEYFAEEVLVVPKGEDFRSGNYEIGVAFEEFEGTWGWPVLYKQTEARISSVWAEWKTDLPESGRYEISVFIPARHATTTRARYKVHGIRGTTTEVVIDINQQASRNRWVSLGIFDLVKEQENAGKVFLNDVTGETDKEIAFDAVRFRRIVTIPRDDDSGGDDDNGGGDIGGTPGEKTGIIIVNDVPVADGFDSPVGTEAERNSETVWPSAWRDVSPYAELYLNDTAYHTGADLNWGRLPQDDLGQPVYSVAAGIVVFAERFPVWGNVIVIRHYPLGKPGGMIVYSRYGHVQNMQVKPGDIVGRGEKVAEVGDAFGRFIPHLHYDISPTTKLESNPEDWPGLDFNRIKRDYIDPVLWIRNNRP